MGREGGGGGEVTGCGGSREGGEEGREHQLALQTIK